MSKKYRFYFFLMLTFLATTSFQNQYDTNAKIKTLFIYNFTRYIYWPSEYKTGSFVVGVLGDSPLYRELLEMSKTKKVFDQEFEIVKFNSTDEIKKCHILLVPTKEDGKLNDCISKTSSFSTLVVTEKQGLGKIAGINFIIQNNKQKFELNKSNLENKKLKVSSDLLSLAILVN